MMSSNTSAMARLISNSARTRSTPKTWSCAAGRCVELHGHEDLGNVLRGLPGAGAEEQVEARGGEGVVEVDPRES